jgi:hypothetical protein
MKYQFIFFDSAKASSVIFVSENTTIQDDDSSNHFIRGFCGRKLKIFYFRSP